MTTRDEDKRDRLLEVYCELAEQHGKPPTLDEVLQTCADVTVDAGVRERFHADVQRWEESKRWWDSLSLPTVSGYSDIRPIGIGGMGIVYRAKQESLQREVALKTMNWGTGSHPTRFRTEAWRLAAVKHPHVVHVHDFIEAEQTPYLVMEYVDGGTLKERIDQQPIDPSEAARCAATVAAAVAQIHKQDILHLDLKPSNVLLTHDGAPIVADFGLAELLGHKVVEATTRGTRSYMAPEQLEGIGDQRTDVYGLGGILYEMLTSRRPLDDPSDEEIRAATPPATRQRNDTIDRDLDAVCMKCLAKDPEERYDSAAAFHDDLTRYLSGMPVTARRLNSLARAGKWARRKPGWALSLVCLVGFLAAVVCGFAAERWQRQRADRTSELARHAMDLTRERIVDYQLSTEDPPIRQVYENLLLILSDFTDKMALDGNNDRLQDQCEVSWWLTQVRSGMGAEKRGEGLASAIKMETAARRLVAQKPNDPHYQFLYGWSFGWQSIFLRDLDRTEEAEEASQTAIAILEPAAANYPEHAGCSIKLGACYLHHSRLLAERGELDTAKQAYENGVRLLLKPFSVQDAHRQQLAFFLERALETAATIDDWKDAAAISGRLVELDAHNPHRRYETALARLANNDIDGYRQVCATMAEDLGSSEDNRVRIIYTCVPAPDAISEMERLSDWAKDTLKLWPGNARLQGAVAYRRGNFSAAVQYFNRTLEVADPRGWDWLFLAMSHHQLGNREQARFYLDKAANWSDYSHWTERVETEHLRREAIYLIEATED